MLFGLFFFLLAFGTFVALVWSGLELFRDKAVGFDQQDPYGELTVSWTGSEAGEIEVEEEFEGTAAEESESGPADAVPVQRTQEVAE